MESLAFTIFVRSLPVHLDNGPQIQDILQEITGQRTVPNVFVNGQHVGGCDKTIAAFSNGTLARMIVEGQQRRDNFDPNHEFDYDLIVIGGGSGGMACAKVRGGGRERMGVWREKVTGKGRFQ